MSALKAQHTIVDPESLLLALQKDYPQLQLSKCRLLALGCNTNYLLEGRRRVYAFRLYRYDWWPKSDVDEELRLLESLDRKKIAVSKPVPCKSGARFVALKTPEGIRYGAMFGYISGSPMAHDYGKNNVNMKMLGRMLAQVHDAADRLKRPIKRWTMDYDNIVPPFLAELPGLLEHRPKDRDYYCKLADSLYDIISKQQGLDFGLCHGDLHTFNVMQGSEGELTIFDFDWCGYSWRAYDLATVWWSMPPGKKSVRPWRAFLSEYRKHRNIDRKSIQLLPWFVVLREFELLNFQQSMRKHVGTAWLDDNYYNRRLDFIRGWVREHIN